MYVCETVYIVTESGRSTCTHGLWRYRPPTSLVSQWPSLRLLLAQRPFLQPRARRRLRIDPRTACA